MDVAMCLNRLVLGAVPKVKGRDNVAQPQELRGNLLKHGVVVAAAQGRVGMRQNRSMTRWPRRVAVGGRAGQGQHQWVVDATIESGSIVDARQREDQRGLWQVHLPWVRGRCIVSQPRDVLPAFCFLVVRYW
jgi:hypothetical protein